MKNLLKDFGVLTMLVLGTHISTAQSQVTTNLVEAHPDFRRVDGKLYNRKLSTLWRDVAGNFVKTKGDGIILQAFEERKIHGPGVSVMAPNAGLFMNTNFIPPYSPVIGVERVKGGRIFVKNYPTSPKPVTGSEIRCRALPVGTLDFEGETIAAYDYGSPNVVAVVKTNHVDAPVTPQRDKSNAPVQ